MLILKQGNFLYQMSTLILTHGIGNTDIKLKPNTNQIKAKYKLNKSQIHKQSLQAEKMVVYQPVQALKRLELIYMLSCIN